MPAQEVARIGIIVAGSAPPIEGFKEGLGELGLVEGNNIRLELRVAQGEIDRLPQFATEIVGIDFHFIAVIGAVTARAFPLSSQSSSSRSPMDWPRAWSTRVETSRA